MYSSSTFPAGLLHIYLEISVEVFSAAFLPSVVTTVSTASEVVSCAATVVGN